jgi:hypothetical protein
MRRFRRTWRTSVLIFAVVLFMGSTAWNVAIRINTQGRTVSSIDSTITALETTCKDNHALSRQYKIRGEAEKALLEFFIPLAREAVNEGKDQTGASQDFINRFAPLAREIQILPLPHCHDQGEQLRSELPPG